MDKFSEAAEYLDEMDEDKQLEFVSLHGGVQEAIEYIQEHLIDEDEVEE